MHGSAMSMSLMHWIEEEVILVITIYYINFTKVVNILYILQHQTVLFCFNLYLSTEFHNPCDIVSRPKCETFLNL